MTPARFMRYILLVKNRIIKWSRITTSILFTAYVVWVDFPFNTPESHRHVLIAAVIWILQLLFWILASNACDDHITNELNDQLIKENHELAIFLQSSGIMKPCNIKRILEALEKTENKK